MVGSVMAELETMSSVVIVMVCCMTIDMRAGASNG